MEWIEGEHEMRTEAKKRLNEEDKEDMDESDLNIQKNTTTNQLKETTEIPSLMSGLMMKIQNRNITTVEPEKDKHKPTNIAKEIEQIDDTPKDSQEKTVTKYQKDDATTDKW